jgi:excisionase family DNA binding protein
MDTSLIQLYNDYLAETGEPAAAAILAIGAAGQAQPRPVRTVLTPPQVAKQLGVDPATVIGWIRSKQLRASNVGKGEQRPRYRIQQSDLDAFLKTRQPEPPSPRKQRSQKSGEVIEFF